MEEWKICIDYPNYEVSNLGNVRRIETKRIKKPFVSDQGYYKVYISLGSKKKKNVRVHRLVAKAFIDNPDNKPEINHKNLNKLDNNVANLEWVTSEENLSHYLEVIKLKMV
jgi:hypothetical protein